MDLTAKRKRNGLRMKHQDSASSVSRSFLCLLISRQSLVPLPDAFRAYGRQRQGFRAEYAPQEEDSARNGLPPDLATAISDMRYLCIRASGTGD